MQFRKIGKLMQKQYELVKRHERGGAIWRTVFAQADRAHEAGQITLAYRFNLYERGESRHKNRTEVIVPMDPSIRARPDVQM